MSSSKENHERLTKAEKDVTAMSKKIQKLTISKRRRVHDQGCVSQVFGGQRD